MKTLKDIVPTMHKRIELDNGEEHLEPLLAEARLKTEAIKWFKELETLGEGLSFEGFYIGNSVDIGGEHICSTPPNAAIQAFIQTFFNIEKEDLK